MFDFECSYLAGERENTERPVPYPTIITETTGSTLCKLWWYFIQLTFSDIFSSCFDFTNQYILKVSINSASSLCIILRCNDKYFDLQATGGKKSNAGAIVGGILGVLIALALIVGGCMWWKKKQSNYYSPTSFVRTRYWLGKYFGITSL